MGPSRRPFRMAALLAAFGTTAATASPDAVFTSFRYRGSPLAGAAAVAPANRYLNPVIAGSQSDPAVVRVGRDYYLATSSFIFWPGIPIFHSRDLVHWTQIGAAVARGSQMRIRGLDTWQGLYAPDLKWRAGRFYLTGTCYGCGGNFIMSARRADGPWSKPAWLPFEGIDPSLFFDVDGRAYVLHNGLPPGGSRYDGHRAIWLRGIDLQTFRLRGDATPIVDGGVGQEGRPYWIEGPHLIRRGSRYVLIAAQGGTKDHHRQVAFGADRLRGPYTPRDTPILTQEGLNPLRPHPVVQAGHADLVETPSGWWAVFLGSRPFGPGELDYTTGRETFLLPVAWRDGWPVILPPGQAVPSLPPAPILPASSGTAPGGGADAFVENWRIAKIDPRWLMLGTPSTRWWTSGRGRLAMTATTRTLGATAQPALLAIRQSAPSASMSVNVRLTGSRMVAAGVTAYASRTRHWALLLARGPSGREVRLLRRTETGDPEGGTVVARLRLGGLDAEPVRLRIIADGPSLKFAASRSDGDWLRVGPAQDGRSLAVSRTDGFTGTILGVVAIGR